MVLERLGFGKNKSLETQIRHAEISTLFLSLASAGWTINLSKYDLGLPEIAEAGAAAVAYFSTFVSFLGIYGLSRRMKQLSSQSANNYDEPRRLTFLKVLAPLSLLASAVITYDMGNNKVVDPMTILSASAAFLIYVATALSFKNLYNVRKNPYGLATNKYQATENIKN